MDVAISTILIVLAIMPSIVAWNSYFSGRFPRHLFGATTMAELAQYVLLAVPIDTIAIAYSTRLSGGITALSLVQAVRGELTTSQITATILPTWRFYVVGYLLLLVACYVGGAVLRRFVWAARLDIRIKSLRMKHDWYYTLQGRIAGLSRNLFPYADVLVEHPQPEGSRLYRGLVSAFESTESGDIKELILTDTKRGKGRGTLFQWASVPGERFVVLGPRIHSINMRYVVLLPPKTFWRRVWYEIRSFALSFLFQTP